MKINITLGISIIKKHIKVRKTLFIILKIVKTVGSNMKQSSKKKYTFFEISK